MTLDDITRMAREEAENWRSRYELISLEVSFWRKRHDMLLQAMADSAALTARPPMFLANKESYEMGRLHGAGEEREAIARIFDGPVWSYDYREIAATIRARSKA